MVIPCAARLAFEGGGQVGRGEHQGDDEVDEVLAADRQVANATEYPGMSKCTCDTTGTPTLCGTASNFINQFEVESKAITNFEASLPPTDPRNVQVAEDSSGGYYRDGDEQGCDYIVPSLYVNHYLVDIYEGKGTPIAQPEVLSSDAAWTTWAKCTGNTGVSRGIAEFGINCGNEGTYDSAVAQSLSDDDAYLKANYKSLYVWNIWDYDGCTLNNTDEAASTHEWQSITNGD